MPSALRRLSLTKEDAKAAEQQQELATGNQKMSGSKTAEAQVSPDALQAIAALTARVRTRCCLYPYALSGARKEHVVCSLLAVPDASLQP